MHRSKVTCIHLLSVLISSEICSQILRGNNDTSVWKTTIYKLPQVLDQSIMSTPNICQRSIRVGVSKRFYSTLLNQNEDHTEKIAALQEHLTGRPFDSAKKMTMPENHTVNEVALANDKTALPSPFVSFDSTDAFKMILSHNIKDLKSSKYQKFFRLKYDSTDMYQSQMEMIYSWNERLKKELKEIRVLPVENSMKLTDEAKQIFLNVVNADRQFDFSESLDLLSPKLPHISFENLVSWFVKITPYLTEVQRESFLKSMNAFFEEKILHFHDQTLEKIFLDLLAFNNTSSVTSIITMHDSASNSEFLSSATLRFSQIYLESLIKQKDIKVAHHVFEYIVEQGYKPPPETVAKFAELINETSNSVDATKQKKEMLFNLLAKPLFTVLMEPKMLNVNVIKSLLDFIRLHNIANFIKYLQNNPEYKNIKEIPLLILNRISSSTTFLKKSDQRKAVFLTGTLNQIGFSADELEDAAKNKIINMYADLHSPLAVLKWSKELKSSLTLTQKQKILEQLKGVSDNLSNSIDISDKL